MFQKPFLKWVGGKTQIIKDVTNIFPSEMNNYHEIFLGGGSVLMALLTLVKDKKIKVNNKIYANDINESLIFVYKHIQNNKDELFLQIQKYITEYDCISGKEINRKPRTIEDAKTSKESYYYWIRNKYNKEEKLTIDSSAMFMFINKTCFRGMYREGPNGYNVPYGHYKKTPTIITKETIDTISKLIKDVEFNCCDFKVSMNRVCQNDFVYLDPPYAPENSKSFVGYVADGFTIDTHNTLFGEIKKMNKKNVKFVLSNAKVELVLENFSDFNVKDIVARRAINAKKPGSKTTEVVIYN
jgi:DNA adenine methylase